MSTTGRTDIGLYVHVPFCTSKCGYCDFHSHTAPPEAFEPLVDALLTELDAALQPRDVRVETIFVGGGTPTVLPLRQLDTLLTALGDIARRDGCVEFTVEANPATVSEAKARLMKSRGVHRVSLGAQSFHPRDLAALDREHRPEDVPASIDILRRAGLTRYNLDLIFGVPGQSLDDWLASLRAAVRLEPEHLSCYGLTYEPGTRLRRRLQLGRLRQVAEEVERDMYLATLDALEGAGYRQYEISNYARPGRECRHNLRYWRNLPGIGIGPSAASYRHGRRWRNIPDTAEYVRRIASGVSPRIDEEELSPLERAGETAMLALRTREGIDRTRFREDTGHDPFRLYETTIARHAGAGLLTLGEDHVALSREGLLVADAILPDFLCPEAPPAQGSAAPTTH